MKNRMKENRVTQYMACHIDDRIDSLRCVLILLEPPPLTINQAVGQNRTFRKSRFALKLLISADKMDSVKPGTSDC